MMDFWNQISLRVRIYSILGALVSITLLGGVVMIWYTYQMEHLTSDVIERHMAAFQVAENLESALVNQKGFVSYYFLDGNPDWLKQLGEYRQIFKGRLAQAEIHTSTDEERQAIARIAEEYGHYVSAKDVVIECYQAGERERGAQLHDDVRQVFFKILELCESYKAIHAQRIQEVKQESLLQARRLRTVAGTAMVIVVVLGLLFGLMLINHILSPLQRLARLTSGESNLPESKNEVKALSRRVFGLMEDIDQTHTELRKSRETLLQAEKMALVGKLAAGTAHSIRNPLTSVKMRLFSLNRSLDLSPTQKEDLDVISQEIRHIDTILQNFLEFSRPPKLKIQEASPSEVVDLAVQLMQHRLESYNVAVRLHRHEVLPRISLDPEQLKEVFVNLIVNACEAMQGGGLIDIYEVTAFDDRLGRVVRIRLTDDGPGMSEAVQAKVFQPFYTTKEEGTGLGLSIAARIVEEHGGRIDLSSTEGEGSAFTITLPIRE